MFKIHTQPFYSPIDLGGVTPSIPASPLSSSDIENALAEDDSVDDSVDDANADDGEEKIVPDFELKLDKEDDSEEDEEPEEEDSKEESGEEDEFKLEDEDEIELAKIPTRAELKKAYPDIFKKFKALDHIIHREHAFAEIFPTVNDAKQAKESLGDFSRIQEELYNGNLEGILQSVHKESPKSYSKIADNILETLIKIDPNSHLGVTQRVSKTILNYINSSATASLKRNPEDRNAQQLQIAAELIHQALYDTTEITPYASAKKEPEENPELENLRKERQSFEQQRFTSAFQSVASRTKNLLETAVTRDIDPKGILPPYVKSKVISDTMDELDRQLSSDNRFRGVIEKLWAKAKEDNYSDKALNNIRTALKEKAKTVLPGIMRAKRGEAMKGLSGVRVKEQPRSKREDNRAPREKLTRNRSENDRNEPRDGESIRDFMMRD